MSQTALRAFLARKAEIDATLEALAAWSDEHFGVAPDEVHWGHVGELDAWLEHLQRIVAFSNVPRPPQERSA